MTLYNLIMSLAINTALSCLISVAVYSYKGFGSIYVDNYFGGRRQYDTMHRHHSKELTTVISVLSPLLYNLLLIFLVNNVWAPHSINDLLVMTFFLCSTHLLLEAPHIAYENRSYTALAVHVVFHSLQTFVPLYVLISFFSVPKISMRV